MRLFLKATADFGDLSTHFKREINLARVAPFKDSNPLTGKQVLLTVVGFWAGTVLLTVLLSNYVGSKPDWLVRLFEIKTIASLDLYSTKESILHYLIVLALFLLPIITTFLISRKQFEWPTLEERGGLERSKYKKRTLYSTVGMIAMAISFIFMPSFANDPTIRGTSSTLFPVYGLFMGMMSFLVGGALLILQKLIFTWDKIE